MVKGSCASVGFSDSKIPTNFEGFERGFESLNFHRTLFLKKLVSLFYLDRCEN